MKNLLTQFVQLREKSHDYGEEIKTTLNIGASEISVGVFSMIFNHLTLCLELLSYYLNVWSKTKNVINTSIEKSKQENAERVIMIEKMTYILVISSIEFSSKECIEKITKKIFNFKKRVYLREIMKKSEENKLISRTDFELWDGVIELRNTLVHNNGISEKNLKLNYPQCVLELQKDKMTRGSLKLFPSLIDWLLDAYKRWVLNISKI